MEGEEEVKRKWREGEKRKWRERRKRREVYYGNNVMCTLTFANKVLPVPGGPYMRTF